MNDYVYQHAQEWVKREEELMRAQPAACLFIAWAHHIGGTEYGICNKIDFMVPTKFNIVIAKDKEESLNTKVQAYLDKLEIGTFQKLLLELAQCYKNGSVKIEWEQFPNKLNPGTTFPHNFIQWLGSPAGMGKRYYRLTMINPKLTCDYILEVMCDEIIKN